MWYFSSCGHQNFMKCSDSFRRDYCGLIVAKNGSLMIPKQLNRFWKRRSLTSCLILRFISGVGLPVWMIPRPNAVKGDDQQHLSTSDNPKQAKNTPYICTNCGKTYQWQISLQRHMRVECGKAPRLGCPICTKCFHHKHHLMSHIATHKRPPPSF